MKWFIRTFGLKGSWKWACKQMQKGHWIKPANASGNVKYKLDHECQQRVVWTFKNKPTAFDWQSASLFLSDFNSVNWICVKKDESNTY